MNVLVNEKKKARAEIIVGILGRTARNEEETQLKETFSILVKENKVGEKDVLEFVYSKLGGLVRTEGEHKAAKAEAKKQKKHHDEKTKGKKKE